MLRIVAVLFVAFGLGGPGLSGHADAQARNESEGGRVSLELYEKWLAGEGEPKEREFFAPYMLGLLAGIEWTAKDQRDRGLEQTFCPPENMVFTVADLHATIQAEVKNHPDYWKRKSEQAVGWAAATGYQARFPCPATAPVAPVAMSGKQAPEDILTVAEFSRQYRLFERVVYSAPKRVLIGYTLGFRDGIDGMQFLVEENICVPTSGSDFMAKMIAYTGNRELRGRRDYWADKQNQSVGEAMMNATKRLYPCKR